MIALLALCILSWNARQDVALPAHRFQASEYSETSVSVSGASEVNTQLTLPIARNLTKIAQPSPQLVKGRVLPILYISPTGAGDQSGTSAANAATLNNLNTMMYRAGPGGQVLLLADQGAYNVSADLQIYSGGVTVRGVSSAGAPMQATLSGTTITLRNGSNDLTFEDLLLKDTSGGYGALRIAGDLHGLTVDNVDAANVRTFLGVGASAGQTASIDGLTVRNVEVVGYTSGAIKIAGNSSHILLEDIVLDGQNKDPSSFMVGVQMYDTAHDIIIRRVTALNNTYTGTDYWNGDGFVAEGGVYNLRLEDTIARNNGDAGYDIKASNTVLDNVLAEGNKRNFRFWGDGIVANNITGLDPHKSGGTGSQNQVWMGENAQATITGGTFTDHNSGSVDFELETGAKLTLVGGVVTYAPSSQLESLNGTAAINRITAPAVTAPQPSDAASALVGSDGADHLQGLDTNDELRGEGGDDYIRGGDGDDRIYGGPGFDDVHGNMGNDTVDGGLGPDWVVGGQGADLLFGQEDGDIVLGNLGDDTCVGGSGSDVVRGGRDNDSVSGGDGDDFISGDRGADTVSGGAGADTFNFFAGAGVDRVTDFNFAEGDRVRIEGGAAYNVTAVGSDTVINLGDGDQMVLVGVSPSSLHEGWLILA